MSDVGERATSFRSKCPMPDAREGSGPLLADAERPSGRGCVCALVAASEFNASDFRRRWESDCFSCIIAVDGGFAYLEEVGCVPDLALGDFDSLGYVPDAPNVKQHPAHKDESDLELAFMLAAERGFSEAVVYGALGGRLDHTVANMQMCARYAEGGMRVELVGVEEVLTILAGPATLQLSPRKHGTVSVFSAVPQSFGVTERGLEYPLEDATLTNRTSLGLSNEFVGKPVSISVERGTLYVFHPCQESVDRTAPVL